LGAQLRPAQGPVRLRWRLARLDVMLLERDCAGVAGVVLAPEPCGQVTVVLRLAAAVVEVDPGVEPGTGLHRRHLVRLLSVKGLRVELVDAAEAAELALPPVEVTVMVGVRR